MATLSFSKTKGNGDDTFTITGEKNLGRNSRTYNDVLVKSTAEGVETQTIKVTQAASAPFVSGKYGDTQRSNLITVSKDGETITLTFYSNASQLKLSWQSKNGYTTWNSDGEGTDDSGTTYPTPSLPCDVEVNGSLPYQTGGVVYGITAGEDDAYEATCSVTFAANTELDKLTRVLRITPYSSDYYYDITFEQTKDTPSLTVSPTSIVLNADGTGVNGTGATPTITVTSNVSWTVESDV